MNNKTHSTQGFVKFLFNATQLYIGWDSARGEEGFCLSPLKSFHMASSTLLQISSYRSCNPKVQIKYVSLFLMAP